MRTFEIQLQQTHIVKQRTFNRIPEKLKMTSQSLRECIGQVLIKLTQIIGDSIHFFDGFTQIMFTIAESYRELGCYYMNIRSLKDGTRITVCDAHGQFIQQLGFTISLDKKTAI